jgi:tetratricopeptide (TPR) repeat protein
LNVQGQTKKRILAYQAKINVAQEDYAEASLYYDSLYCRDSSNLQLLADYTQNLFLEKNLKKGVKIAERLIQIDKRKKFYPYSYLQLGLIYKQLGKYDEAKRLFSEIQTKDKKKQLTYIYLKASREVESCEWALNQVKDSSKVIVEKIKNINTKDSEFGHTMIDSTLIISSLNSSIDTSLSAFPKEYYTNKLYTLNLKKKKEFVEIKALNSTTNHTSNGTFSHTNKKFYYSSCSNQGDNKRCRIMSSTYAKRKWKFEDTLAGEINLPNFSYTMPAIAYVDGTEYLVFCSDKDSKGGLDIFYGEIENNQVFNVKPIDEINSIENDIAPYFDIKTNKLYFASSWFNGYGGYDIFSIPFPLQANETPQNIGLPYNSSTNDTYIFKDTLSYYITSNRDHEGENQTCCSDIFKMVPIPLHKKENSIVPILTRIDSVKIKNEEIRTKTSKINLTKLEQLIPVVLYYHNDIPHPNSLDTTATLNYIQTYQAYKQLLPLYQQQYSKGLIGEKKVESIKEITSFFNTELKNGINQLDSFLLLLEQELKNGTSLELIFKGYASPLAQSKYNEYLSKRRISAVRNYIAYYKNGILLKYLLAEEGSKPQLTFKEEPFGEFKAESNVSDNPADQRNSIYSKKAALERKVEIIGFRVL